MVRGRDGGLRTNEHLVTAGWACWTARTACWTGLHSYRPAQAASIASPRLLLIVSLTSSTRSHSHGDGTVREVGKSRPVGLWKGGTSRLGRSARRISISSLLLNTGSLARQPISTAIWFNNDFLDCYARCLSDHGQTKGSASRSGPACRLCLLETQSPAPARPPLAVQTAQHRCYQVYRPRYLLGTATSLGSPTVVALLAASSPDAVFSQEEGASLLSDRPCEAADSASLPPSLHSCSTTDSPPRRLPPRPFRRRARPAHTSDRFFRRPSFSFVGSRRQAEPVWAVASFSPNTVRPSPPRGKQRIDTGCMAVIRLDSRCENGIIHLGAWRGDGLAKTSQRSECWGLLCRGEARRGRDVRAKDAFDACWRACRPSRRPTTPLRDL
ncbi:hypothetical protein BJY59DRAFT_253725 [Rhodotorula toruloides]